MNQDDERITNDIIETNSDFLDELGSEKTDDL